MKNISKYLHGTENPFEKIYKIDGLLVGLTSNGWLMQEIYYKDIKWDESYLIKLTPNQMQVIHYMELKSNI